MNTRNRESAESFAKASPNSFDAPEKLPGNPEEAANWQSANRDFWESHPMRYDWNEELAFQPGTREFYDEVDRRFFENVRPYMPWQAVPFERMIPFADLRDKKVLEIGVGMGSHAGLIAPRVGDYTGIDLTGFASRTVQERMRLFGYKADIRQMDAETLDFPDESFDFVWSWGVIHHSSNTRRILEEIRRVLKPGGKLVIMVYHRGWWNYYICGGLLGGLRRGTLFSGQSIAKTVQNDTDGALARYYSPASWRAFVSPILHVDEVWTTGPKTDLVPLPGGRLKNGVMASIPNALARFMTNQLRMGGFLCSTMSKR